MTIADALGDLGQTLPPDHAGKAWRMELTPDHADVETGPVDEGIRAATAVGDWSGVLRHFGLDPAEFEVVDDTVRMSSWQTSKRLENGDRDEVWLYAYRARFRRVTARLPEADVQALRDRVHKWRPAKPPMRSGPWDVTPSTFYLGWADWQAGKGNLDALADNVTRSIEAAVLRVRELRKLGRNLESLCIANMGDPIEGCMGNYDNQLFTVSATKREQLNAVLDLWCAGLRVLAPLFDDVQFVSVLSNHGEWSRPAGRSTKALTSDSDSADAFLAETLRRVMSERNDMGHVRWVIPHDEMTVQADLSGVRAAFAHGHKAPGSAKELEWMRGQSIRLLHETGAHPDLWFTAHRHHFDARDYGPWWRFQHPTLEVGGPVGGSKWFTDMSGQWSTPGTLSMLVGRHDPRGWSDVAVL